MKNSETKNIQRHSRNTGLCDGFLIPMTDFVLRINEIEKEIDQFFDSWKMKQLRIIENYAKFLKQPLKLEMFVACDEMKEVMNYEEIKQSVIEGTDSWDAYEKAKEKVLFEGFEFVSRTDETWLFKINGNFPIIVSKKGTVESLIIIKDQIKLSQTALNAIFG